VRHYLDAVSHAGVPVVAGVVYGSYARGEEGKDSDIDLLVISHSFDGRKDSHLVNALWRMTWRVDSRIEPVPVGVREFESDDASPLIHTARKEGVLVNMANQVEETV
jgi:predicted nucleotidyltransferase